MKKVSMKLSDYFQIVHPKYVCLKIIPHTSIRNYNSGKIIEVIQCLYKTFKGRVYREERKFFVQTQLKCSYMIDICKNNVSFYFIVPERYEDLFKEKINDTWDGAIIQNVSNIKDFSDNAIKYQLRYNKEDALSLQVNKKTNQPINSILNVLNILQEDDRVGIFYNFMPVTQKYWRKDYEVTMEKIKNNKLIDKQKFNAVYIFKEITSLVYDILEDVLDTINEFVSGRAVNRKKVSLSEIAITSLLGNKKKPSEATIQKKNSVVISTQMMIISDSNDNIRRKNNAMAVIGSYNTVAEDNKLIYEKLPKKNVHYMTDFKIIGVEENRLSIDECQNLVQIPGRELLQKHKVIEKVDVLETQVPKELRIGTKRIGISEYKGTKQTAYYTTDKDYKNLATIYIGPTRSGKTTALCNYAKDSIDAGESIVVTDFIETCQLTEDIKKYIPKEKIVEIDLSNFSTIEGLGYNELDIENDDPLELYNNAKLKTNQLEYLINSINVDNEELKARMERYLDAAALVVFICGGSIKDIFTVLQDHTFRRKYIDAIPKEQVNNLEEYIISLEELDEWSRATKDKPSEIIGTKTSYVQGILNRITKLKKNTVLELMLKKDVKNNIDLCKEIQDGKAIFIKMPENRFGTPEERDIITTYWLTKLWLALQIRASQIPNRYDRKTVSIITDELGQLEAAQRFVGVKLSQCAKFGGKFIISTMYINELKIREKLRTANTSYILISGCDKTNYTELKEELSEFGFTLEDLMHLKRFYSLNYIKYEEGYTAFISKLPAPITKKP